MYVIRIFEKYLRNTDKSTVVLNGPELVKAGWLASQAQVTPLSELVGLNLIVENVVILESGDISSISSRFSEKAKKTNYNIFIQQLVLLLILATTTTSTFQKQGDDIVADV